MPLGRQYVKLCDLADFDDPAVLGAISEVVPERDPVAHIERKVWEFALLVLFLRDVGRLHDRTRALAVGAGDERIIFWLANHLAEVVATDIYGDGEFAAGEAAFSTLNDPASHAPYPYREERLKVCWMDARTLDFSDASFDVVFSLSSIEHVGGPSDVRRASSEIGRVLRPGGHAAIVTDHFVRRHPLRRAPVDFAVRALTAGHRRSHATPWRRQWLDDVFTTRELMRDVVRPSGLRLMQPLQGGVSDATWDNLTELRLPEYELVPATGSRYPQILVGMRGCAFTSVFLALEKPGHPAAPAS